MVFYECSSLKFNEYSNAKYLGNGINPYFLLCDVIYVGISSLDLHDDTKIIGDYALDGCYLVTSLTIPNGVEIIGENVLNGCRSLSKIFFKGSKTQWDNISKAPNWSSNSGSFTVSYVG